MPAERREVEQVVRIHDLIDAAFVRRIGAAALPMSSDRNDTPKSKLKSLASDDSHRNRQPIRRWKRSIAASGARETATNEVLRWARCAKAPSMLSETNDHPGHPSFQLGSIMN